MSEPTTTIWKHLAPNPKSKYKELFIKGRRIRATVLYGWHVCAEPRSAEEIAALVEMRHLSNDTHHCPHGRPTALLFTRHELDRQFRRI